MVPLTDGMSVECNEEKFQEYLEELKSVAQKIVENLDQN